MGRMVKVTRREIVYYTEEVDLYTHLYNNLAEIYLSNENKCVEIRFPTRIEHYTHYVAHVPFAVIADINEVRDMIKNERHMEFIQRHIDDVVWNEEFSNTVTK